MRIQRYYNTKIRIKDIPKRDFRLQLIKGKKSDKVDINYMIKQNGNYPRLKFLIILGSCPIVDLFYVMGLISSRGNIIYKFLIVNGAIGVHRNMTRVCGVNLEYFV